MKKNLSRSLFFAVVLSPLAAFSAQAMTSHMNSADLLAKADLIIMGETVSVDLGVDTTRAQIRVLQVLKGPEKPGNLITVEAKGGKVFIEESEPVFNTLQADLLFLQKSPGGWACVNGADGQKTVRGRFIYPYSDNLGYSVPSKDYLKGLEEALKGLKASAAQGAADNP